MIDAMNQDMPYDTFVKAQIAGELLPNNNLRGGLSLFGLGPLVFRHLAAVPAGSGQGGGGGLDAGVFDEGEVG